MHLKFAWRYFKAKKSANAINIIAWVTVGVIAFATCCQVLVLSVFNGLEGLVKSLYSSFYTDLKVVPASGKTFTLNASQIAQIKQQPGVANICLEAEEKALLKNEGSEMQTVVSLKGVDDNYPNVSGVASKTSSGKYATGTTEDPYIVAGAGIQNAIEFTVDPALPSAGLSLILPKRTNSNDPLESISEGTIRASGVFSIQQEFDETYAITNIGFVKQQMGFGADEYSAVEIKLGADIDPASSAKALQQKLGPSFKIVTRYEQNMSLYNTMRLEKWAIYGILTLILIIASFNMVSSLTMLVLEKRKDISVLQSLGTNRSGIMRIFLSEGILLAAIGALIGIGLAVLLCYLQMQFKIIKLNGDSFLIDYFPVKLLVTDFLLVAATVGFIAFLAAWFPARKASRQSFELR